ncbi:hypothetical protein N9878_01035 [bacterium]|nr:hypothetical protein [bacterium]
MKLKNVDRRRLMNVENIIKVKNIVDGVKCLDDGCGFVYELIYFGECVYVGQTVDLKARLHYHLSRGKKFDSINLFTHEISNLNNEEAAKIAAINPPLNKVLPSNDLFISEEELRDMVYDSVINSLSFDYQSKLINKKRFISIDRANSIVSKVSDIILKAESIQ